MTQHDKILEKIRKCMALSSSSNEHEAAIALRQAQKLMELHGITDVDVKAAQAEERRARASARRRPAGWENMLASDVASAFGCRLIFCQEWDGGRWSYIGCGAAPEIAQYAFTVLLRQVKKARAEHIETKLNRCKAVTKTRRADLFCEGWVRSVSSTISALAADTQRTEAINAFIAVRYPELSALKTQDRNQGKKLSDREIADYLAGSEQGKVVRLNHGMGHQSSQMERISA
ncbi:DUF2786 domain-containing protein [Limnohabitans radicicola]|uniref:DUF2786 domain-containing protein n=1 Tax=Limnohabitans radicicola TaxID=2771427 RepID=A0A927FI42_9BURK|nr:DUF2786 domain-containing protein [Limnohabitans radicicola]MBD8051131.1 DUF2786 domain-containing protein [Limnohabitans radicicola]